MQWRYVAAIALLGGCAHTSKVVQISPGTFMAASRGAVASSTSAAEKSKAYDKAGQFCKHLGKTVEVINSFETQGSWHGRARGEVEFRCN